MKMRKLFIACGAALLAVAWGCVSSVYRSAGVAYVDTYDLSGASCGFDKKVQSRKSVDGTPLTVCGKVYAHGVGTHPESGIAFALNGKVTAFDALVGIDDAGLNAKRGTSVAAAFFKVWVDGRIAWKSPVVAERQKPVAVHVDLTGAKEVVLEAASGPQWRDYPSAYADWLDARFTYEAGASIEPLTDAALTAQLGILTPPEKPEPQFNGADIWGVRPGRPVIFRVPTSGVRPMTFTAVGLPTGVTLDAQKGILGGVAPKEKGDYDITITACNAHGSATRTIRLAVGDTIALTPPMGWNSWNVCEYRLTDAFARRCTLAMEQAGLGDYGWAYVNLDDWWQRNNVNKEGIDKRARDLGHEDVRGPVRDEKGYILPNRSFPDMKAFTDYVHSFGFKAGLYSSPGPRTCGDCEGSYGHEAQDAETWAKWGFDYVKYDWCVYDEIAKHEMKKDHWWETTDWRFTRTEEKEKPYRLMSACLARQNRDIVHSFCQYGMGHAELWARDAGAQCWRSWGDLKDGWTWMELAIESNIKGEYYKYSGPGCWADPDMMLVGTQFYYGYDHPTFLTPNEQYTHVSIWSMISAPMLLGCDLSKLDAFTRSLLVNREVIAISQDRLGRPAKRVRHVDGESVWVRTLANGDVALALVNRSPLARTISVALDELKLPGTWRVRDVWRQADEPVACGTYGAYVLPHATKLVRLTRAFDAAVDKPTPFMPLLEISGKGESPVLFPEIPVFRDTAPVYVFPRCAAPQITLIRRHEKYPDEYVRVVRDDELRKTPYNVEDLATCRHKIDNEYTRSGRPFFIDDSLSRPPFFLRGDGSPLADRKGYAEWIKAHPGFQGFVTLSELDSDSNYFTKFYDNLPTEGNIRRDLQAAFERPAAKGLAHRLQWAREARRRTKEMLFGEERFSTMSSGNLGYQHIFGALEPSLLWYEATSQHIGSWNAAAAFVRGAARQRDLPFGWYAAQYYNGFTRDGKSACGDTAWFDCADYGWLGGQAPHRGESRSLHRRQMLFGWLVGAKWIEMEFGKQLYCAKDASGKVVPSDYAKDYAEIYELSQNRVRGESLTPLAILTPLAEPSDAHFQNSLLLDGKSQNDIFRALSPICGDSGLGAPNRKKGEQGCLYNTPYGEIYDVLCPDAGQDSPAFARALRRYSHVIVAGRQFDAKSYDQAALDAFVRHGGKVHRYPSAELSTPDQLKALLASIRDETMPVSVSGDIQWGVNRTAKGYLVYLINNKGVIKFCDEPETFDLTRTARVTVTFKASGETRTVDVKPGDFKLMEFTK